MRTTLLTVVLVAVGIPQRAARANTQAGGSVSNVVTLAGLRDHARPLLIFAPKPDDPQLQIQLRTIARHAPELAERHITTIALPYNGPSPTSTVMKDGEAAAARRRFHITPADFTVLLIGKDGGEKFRSSKPITVDTLSETVDAMPMRQEEMRRQHR